MSGQELKRDRNLETETDAEATEGVLLTGLFLLVVQPAFLLPMGGTVDVS